MIVPVPASVEVFHVKKEQRVGVLRPFSIFVSERAFPRSRFPGKLYEKKSQFKS
jgi:hypothetical protein